MSPEPSDIAPALARALAAYALSAAALAQLAAHWQLLLRWNARVNLTAVTDPAEAAELHYRDSLAVLPYLPDDGPLVDIGSGAGFPGLVLAVARPHWEVTLVEPRRKRASFLQAAVARLGLMRVRVLATRLEAGPDRLYAHAVTRATFSDAAARARVAAWLRPGGALYAYRSAPDAAAPHATTLCRYTVAGRPRAIERWAF